MESFGVIYSDITPHDPDVIKVVSPENYTLKKYTESSIEPTTENEKVVIAKGTVIYAKRRKTDPSGLYYLAFSRNQSYWNFCVGVGHTKLEDEILKQLKQKKDNVKIILFFFHSLPSAGGGGKKNWRIK
ncbi:MAG: hypothetical protein ACTSPL_04160 [Candidatus Odinarchaeia archaeon]